MQVGSPDTETWQPETNFGGEGGLGLPPTAWVDATNTDLGLWKEKIQGLVRGLISQSNPKMGGFRIAVRAQLHENHNWVNLLDVVEEQVNALLDYAQGLEVNRGALLEAKLSRTERVEADQWSKLFCSKE